jgi:hypothetical protein
VTAQPTRLPLPKTPDRAILDHTSPESENVSYGGRDSMKLPRAILFDLDDTILVAFGPAQSQWQRTIAAFADRLGPIEATVIAAAIEAAPLPRSEPVGRVSVIADIARSCDPGVTRIAPWQ